MILIYMYIYTNTKYSTDVILRERARLEDFRKANLADFLHSENHCYKAMILLIYKYQEFNRRHFTSASAFGGF